MNLQGYYTTQGAALAVRIAAGTAALTVTKVTAGSGQTALPSAAALADTKQTLSVGAARVSGSTAVLPVTLAEASAAAGYTLTELGVYARDPAEGEILYQVFRLDAPRAVTKGGEDTLRFYLRQSIGNAGVSVTCSSAGLLVDEDLDPVRADISALNARVEVKSIPDRSVTVALSELKDYLLTMPRLLTENLTINVTVSAAGETLDDNLHIVDLYGPGTLTIMGGGCTVNGCVECQDCTCLILLNDIHFCAADFMTTFSHAAVRAHRANSLTLFGCTLTGNGSCSGISAYQHSRVAFEYGSIKNCARAVWATICSQCTVFCESTQVAGFTENTIGAYAERGSIIGLGDLAPVLLGAGSNAKNGGVIVKADGTLV